MQAQTTANMGAHRRINTAFANEPVKAAIFIEQPERQGKWRMRHIGGANVQKPSNIFRLRDKQHILTRRFHLSRQCFALLLRCATGKARRLKDHRRVGQFRPIVPIGIKGVFIKQHQSCTLGGETVAIGFHRRFAVQTRVEADFHTFLNRCSQPLRWCGLHNIDNRKQFGVGLFRRL